MQELNTRLLENLLPGHPAKSFFEHAVGPGITIVIGIAKQCASLIEQGEVNSPCVDAKARHFGAR